MSAAAPSVPVIEVPGCGMHLRVMKDPAGWSVSGWRRAKGTVAMVVYVSAESAPTFMETAGQHHVIAGRTYIAVPPASRKRLQAFISSTEGPSAQGGAA
ncbi:TPA: hypothetical protein ACKPX2_000633 [Stenotrophomonas maltophilia]|uniref:hypothetical protein n=1 Tax=Stenotrophomonas maltophilia TaxID=40324 RepID=UPI001EF782B8|nr:hypothetical protein [Stenotrophomonas maltophilia]